MLSPFRSPILLLGTIAAFLIHVAAMHLSIGQSVLGTAPISLHRWGLLLLLAMLILPASELHKWWMATTADRR
jgi:hypothetical protein